MEENKDSRENEIAALKLEIERLKGIILEDSDTPVYGYSHATQSAAEWISVKDRFPDKKDGLVLAFDKENNVILISKYDIGIWFPTEFPERKVTHWMPLPKPPHDPNPPK